MSKFRGDFKSDDDDVQILETRKRRLEDNVSILSDTRRSQEGRRVNAEKKQPIFPSASNSVLTAASGVATQKLLRNISKNKAVADFWT